MELSLFDQPESNDCKACPTGNYCYSGNREECPEGTYNNQTGGVMISDCKICQVGHFCRIGASDGTSCGAGTYQNSTGAKLSCKNCTLGHFCPSEGLIMPKPCKIETFQNKTGSKFCESCPIGRVAHRQIKLFRLIDHDEPILRK